MLFLGPALLETWAPEVAQALKLTEKEVRQGLQCTHFFGTNVLIEHEDGSRIAINHAFIVRSKTQPSRYAVFSEHQGYFELRLDEDEDSVRGSNCPWLSCIGPETL